MSDNHPVGDEFLSAPVSVSSPETLASQEYGVDEEEQQINTLSPDPRRRIRFPQGKLSALAPLLPISGTANELLQFRAMLVNAKSKSTLKLDIMAPSKPMSIPTEAGKRPISPTVSNSRLTSMSSDSVAWERRQAQLRDLKDLNLLLLGIAFGSVLLLAAVVLYMYIQY